MDNYAPDPKLNPENSEVSQLILLVRSNMPNAIRSRPLASMIQRIYFRILFE